jgi:hypothetical protein
MLSIVNAFKLFKSKRSKMFLNEYSIVKIAVSSIDSYFSSLLSILYEYYMKKKARAMEKAILANIPRLRAKSQA